MKVRAEVKGLGELQAAINAEINKLEARKSTALRAGGDVIAERIKHKMYGLFEIGTGKMYKSVHVTTVSKEEVEVREGPLPYVFAQEFGLPNQPITPKQRRFFWAKFFETANSMWRALALSATYTIPARPHFRPGVDEAKHDAALAIADAVQAILGGR